MFKKTGLIFSLFCLIFSLPAMAAKAKVTDFSPAQQRQIETIVHEYIVTHPEVLMEASQALQQKMVNKAKQVAIRATRENASDLLRNPNSPVMGNPKGKITMVEFMDYQCIHCREMSDVVEQIMKANPNLRVVIKEFPIFGDNSILAAKVALAANKQGKFTEMHHALFNMQTAITTDSLLALAKPLGINTDQMKADLDNQTFAEELDNNKKLAIKLSLVGTPAFIIAPTDLQNNAAGNIEMSPGQTSEQDLQALINKVQK